VNIISYTIKGFGLMVLGIFIPCYGIISMPPFYIIGVLSEPQSLFTWILLPGCLVWTYYLLKMFHDMGRDWQ